jgi:hypothetical protein
MLVSASTVFVAVPFLAVRTAVLMGILSRASARVDVGEVERVGLGKIAQVELYDHPVGGVLEGSGASHPRVVLGVQSELYVSALVMGSAVLLPTLALGTATAAPD